MSRCFSLCGRAPWRRASTLGISIFGGAAAAAWTAGSSASRAPWDFITSIGLGFWAPRYACSAKPAAGGAEFRLKPRHSKSFKHFLFPEERLHHQIITDYHLKPVVNVSYHLPKVILGRERRWLRDQLDGLSCETRTFAIATYPKRLANSWRAPQGRVFAFLLTPNWGAITSRLGPVSKCLCVNASYVGVYLLFCC